MTPQEMEKGFEEIWRLFAETDRKFQETDEKFKETDKRIDKAVGSLTSKWGRFVEGMVAPAVERLLGERGIEVDRVYQRVRARREGGAMEIDVLAVDGEYAALVEVKSTLSLDDVNEHLENLGRFRDFFPEYADRKIVGAPTKRGCSFCAGAATPWRSPTTRASGPACGSLACRARARIFFLARRRGDSSGSPAVFRRAFHAGSGTARAVERNDTMFERSP